MIKAVRKTEEELKPQTKYDNIVCKNYKPKYYGYDKETIYWYCSSCKVLFEHEDTVLLKTVGIKEEGLVCPLEKLRYKILPTWFTKPIKTMCLSHLSYGDELYFKTDYNLLPYEHE